jgi:transketolase
VRIDFAEALVKLAEDDERVLLLTGDLGFHVLERFADRFPDRFYNVGVAEQNMLGLAGGLAEAGFVPFCYSIATFASMRPYEFVRNGPVLHELPVRLVGIGGGFDYGAEGVTHFALEDVGLFRLQPGMAVVTPADGAQARTAVRETADVEGPIYFRIARDAAPLPALEGRFELGRPAILGDGEDAAIIALGTTAAEAVEASALLVEAGIKTSVAVVSSLVPTTAGELAQLLERVPLAVSVEAHYATGGVGSLVAEVIAERHVDCRLVRCAVRDVPRDVNGSRAYLYRRYGLDAASIAEAVTRGLARAERSARRQLADPITI